MKTKNKGFDFSVKGKKRKREYQLLVDLYGISEEVYSYRIALNLSQQDLAKRVGTTQKVISKIENAEVNFGIDLILRISRELNLQLKLGEFLSLPALAEKEAKIHNFVFSSLEDINKNEINYERKETSYITSNTTKCWF